MTELTQTHQKVPEISVAAPSQYLTFHIAGETYAVGILQVREILRYEELTTVPSTPKSVRGVMNLRGQVVPVVDLAVKFGLPRSHVTKWTCIVIVETILEDEATTMGVLADAVNEVLEFSPDKIEPPPPFGTRVNVEYLLGMGQADPRFILILDINKVLTVEDAEAVAEVLSSEEDMQQILERAAHTAIKEELSRQSVKEEKKPEPQATRGMSESRPKKPRKRRTRGNHSNKHGLETLRREKKEREVEAAQHNHVPEKNDNDAKDIPAEGIVYADGQSPDNSSISSDEATPPSDDKEPSAYDEVETVQEESDFKEAPVIPNDIERSNDAEENPAKKE